MSSPLPSHTAMPIYTLFEYFLASIFLHFFSLTLYVSLVSKGLKDTSRFMTCRTFPVISIEASPLISMDRNFNLTLQL